MNRTQRIAILAALAIILAAAGTVLAMRPPSSGERPTQLTQDGEDTPPTAEELAHASDRLAAHGLIVSDDLLAELAGQYGVGGAVRIVAWSNGDDAAIADIRAMRDGTETEPGMGWGRIAKELGVHPGIGSIMGGGSGPDDAPGQQGTDEGD